MRSQNSDLELQLWAMLSACTCENTSRWHWAGTKARASLAYGYRSAHELSRSQLDAAGRHEGEYAARDGRGRHTSGPVYQHTSTCVCSCGRASVPVGGPPCRPPNRPSRLVMPLRALSLLLTPLPYSSSFRMFPLSSSPRLLRWRPVSLALLAAPSAQQPSCPVSLGPPPCPPCCPAS